MLPRRLPPRSSKCPAGRIASTLPQACQLLRAFVRFLPLPRHMISFPAPLVSSPLSLCREAEKAAAELLKEASRARLAIDQAAEAAAAAAEEAESVKQQEKEAAAAVAEARAVLKQLETAARRK